MIHIRAFGNDRTCSSIDDLRETLSTHYRGHSVTLDYERASHGMRGSHFIDVLDDGSAVESYGKQAPVKFEALQADMEGRSLDKESKASMESADKHQQTRQLEAEEANVSHEVAALTPSRRRRPRA
ncbi:hypothetical protein NPJ88_000365 [Halomonas elongata]|uniref:hypothetical protein n=1 Tax=Halomonas elongata TaxID=2746 RepID=UPI00255B2A78|nr:hypothetical protein [Halomonas elongata]MDL4860776.1 hypothetical protein [Halomonas elongata]